jgi:hypothetical protein
LAAFKVAVGLGGVLEGIGLPHLRFHDSGRQYLKEPPHACFE